MTMLSYGLPLGGERNRVVVTDLDHQAAVMPWLGHLDGRWQVATAPSDGAGVIDLEGLAELVDDRTAVVAATHVSHFNGMVQPVREVARLARGAGAVSVIDGAQAVGRVPVDIEGIGCDVYLAVARGRSTGGHWERASVGSRRVLDVDPLLVSHLCTIQGAGDAARSKLRLANVPMRFEGNLPDMAALHAMWGQSTQRSRTTSDPANETLVGGHAKSGPGELQRIGWPTCVRSHGWK